MFLRPSFYKYICGLFNFAYDNSYLLIIFICVDAKLAIFFFFLCLPLSRTICSYVFCRITRNRKSKVVRDMINKLNVHRQSKVRRRKMLAHVNQNITFRRLWCIVILR